MKKEEHDIEKLLQRLSKESAPGHTFSQTLLKTLKEEYTALHATPQRGFFYSFKTQFAAALTLFLVTSTSMFAYSSHTVVNGTPLYSLKRGIEKVEGTLATTPEKKAEYYHKMAQRRISEIQHFKSREQIDRTTVQNAEEMLIRAENELVQIRERTTPEVMSTTRIREERTIFFEEQPLETLRERPEVSTPEVIIAEPIPEREPVPLPEVEVREEYRRPEPEPRIEPRTEPLEAEIRETRDLFESLVKNET